MPDLTLVPIVNGEGSLAAPAGGVLTVQGPLGSGSLQILYATTVGDAVASAYLAVTGTGAVGLLGTAEMLWNGVAWERARNPNKFIPLPPAGLAVVAGTPQAIWTPAAGKKFRLMGWDLSTSVGVSVKFLDAAAIIYQTGAHAAGVTVDSPNMGNGILSAAANNVLNVDVTANATLFGTVYGTEE